jgi:hypothetical protein
VQVSSENDVVGIGVALDNIEGTAPEAVDNGVANTLNMAGNYMQGVGSLIGTASSEWCPPCGAVGGVTSAVGAFLAVASSLFSPPGGNAPNWCTGGLVQAPSPAYNALGPISGAQPGQSGPPWLVIPNAPSDTVYLSYTAAQLEALTAAGPATISVPVSVQWPEPYDGVTVNFLGFPPGACDSKHTIEVQVARVPTTGPAADPLSSSIGAARTATEVDGFVADPAAGGLALEQWTPAGGWQTYMASPWGFSVDPFMPSATLSRNLPPPGQSMQFVGTGTNLAWDLDTFWFDNQTGLHWTEWTNGKGWTTATIATPFTGITSGNLTATARTPYNMDVFWLDTGLSGAGYLTTVDWNGSSFSAPTNVLPGVTSAAGGSVAAVSRNYATMDVFFIASNGALEDATWSLSTTSAPSTWTAYQYPDAGLGTPGGSVTAVARDANDIDIFFAGSGNQIYQAHFAATADNTYPAGWTAPAAIAGTYALEGSSLSAVSRAGGIIDLAYTSGTAIDFIEFGSPSAPGGWGAPAAISAVPGVARQYPISLVAIDSQDLALFWTSQSFQHYEATWNQSELLADWQIASPALPGAPISVSVTPSTLGMAFEEGTVASTVTTVNVTGVAGDTVNLTASGVPSGITASFAPTSVATGGTSTLTLVAANGTAPQSFTMSVVGTLAGSNFAQNVPVGVTLSACIPYTNACPAGSCGAASNGCGVAVNCGGCPSGETCTAGSCRRTGCTTPACECVASGGVWDGKYCE